MLTNREFIKHLPESTQLVIVMDRDGTCHCLSTEFEDVGEKPKKRYSYTGKVYDALSILSTEMCSGVHNWEELED